MNVDRGSKEPAAPVNVEVRPLTPRPEVPEELQELLRKRWSPRAFADLPIEPHRLRSLFEAARWAPSSFNEQSWSFIVTTRDDPGPFGRLADTLSQRNRLWAPRAPVLVLSVARLAFLRNGKPNRHALHDVGLAVWNLIVQATSLGIVVHQMAGFDTAMAQASFGIPEGFEPVAVIAIGYPGDPATLPPDLREREGALRTRKPLEEFVFSGRWGEPFTLGAQPRKAEGS